MDLNIKELLEEEMCKCNSLKVLKNKVKKCNNILPDDVMNNVLSFMSCDCKKCVRTRRVMNSEVPYIKYLNKKWENFDIEEKIYTNEYTKYQNDGVRVWLYYFTKLNYFPHKSSFYKRFTATDFDETDVMLVKKSFEDLCFDGVPIYRNYREPSNKFRDVMVWLLYERGCQFYPHIFSDEFARAVMFLVFHSRD